MSDYAGEFYETLHKDLTDWVWNNKKLMHKITRHNLKYLFEFHPNRGLSIDLRRFELDFYLEVFYPPEAKKKNIDEFVRKVCMVIGRNLKHGDRPDLTITISVSHMISEVSHWKTFFIDRHFDDQTLRPLTEKEEDWYYSFKRKT